MPKPLTGKIVELDSRATIPPGTTNVSVHGNPFLLSVGNLNNLPSYERVAAAVVQVKPLEFHIFVAINAPKGLVNAQRKPAAAAEADALDLIVAGTATFFPAAGVDVIGGDGCKAYKIEVYKGYETTTITLGPWASPGKSIISRTIAADSHCK